MKKKLLTGLLIGTTLSGVANSTAFALDNLSANSSVAVQKMSRSGTYYTYTLNDYPYYKFFLYNGKLYMYDKISGCYLTGLITIRGHKLYFDPNSYNAQVGWFNTGGHRYYFDPKTFASLQNGLHEINGTKYLFNSSGQIMTGLNRIYGGTYYTNRVGAVLTGWYTLNDSDRYYFDPNNGGKAYTGWYRDFSLSETNGQMYFFPDGRMAMGVTYINGEKYLFRPHGKGENFYKTYGYYSVGKDRYYFDQQNNGKAMRNRWLQIGRGWMYFKDDGTMARGVNTINGKTFVFTQAHRNDWNYYRDLGWYTDKSTGKRYYFGGYEGEALTGTQYINGVHYYFNRDGSLYAKY